MTKTRPIPCPTIRTLVVDDYESFRQYVRATLQGRAEFQGIGEASDGLQAVQKADELPPDLILLDIGWSLQRIAHDWLAQNDGPIPGDVWERIQREWRQRIG
jgi:DNA-binding NarL/FixJ family response regulator